MDLYKNMYYCKEIKGTSGSGETYEMSIALLGLDGKPDCQIGHFGYNFFFRTPYGTHYKKYKTAKTMEKSVEKALKNNGFTNLEWITAQN